MLKAWSTIKKSQAGFSPVEILLAATVFGFLVIAVTGAIIYGRGSTASAGERARATQIADEGVEVVRNLRDNSFVNLTDGTYGLAQSGGTWSLSGTPDTTGIYTRQVVISTINANRKSIVITVTWPQNTTTAQVVVSSELTNWYALFKSWTGSVPGGSYDAPGTNDGLKIASKSHFVYIVRTGNSSPNFLIIDVANLASPTLVGSLTLPGSPTNISINGNSAYVTNSSATNQLQIIDISNANAPSLTTTFNCPGNAGALGISTTNNFAYVTRAANGNNAEFCIVDTTNSKKPKVFGWYDNNVSMYGVYVANNDAYLVTSSDTQEIMHINIQKPTPATPINSVNLPGTADALSIRGGQSNTIFVGQGSNLVSLSIATSPPTILGSVSTSGSGLVNDIAFDTNNNYAFLATNAATAEFQTADISNPANMSIIRALDTTGALNGITYITSSDVLAAASSSDTQELMFFVQN